jgi:hypothetical protein
MSLCLIKHFTVVTVGREGVPPHIVTEQVGLSGDISDLYLGEAHFESWLRRQFSQFFLLSSLQTCWECN